MIVAETGFEDCYRLHVARLVALGETMAGDREVARDLAHEAFLRLHRHWESVAGYQDVGGWLARVMANLLIDHHRSRDAQRRAVERLARRPDVGSAGIELEGDGWTTLVAALPLRQRVIVTLHYAEDLSVVDIAEALEISPGTVKSALSKARDALRSRGDITDA